MVWSLSLCKVGTKNCQCWKSTISFMPCQKRGQIQPNEGGTAWPWNCGCVAVQRSEAKSKNLPNAAELTLFQAPFSQAYCGENRSWTQEFGSSGLQTTFWQMNWCSTLLVSSNTISSFKRHYCYYSICQLLKKKYITNYLCQDCFGLRNAVLQCQESHRLNRTHREPLFCMGTRVYFNM